MLIKIEDFRQHQSTEVVFPSTGLVLLSGVSGAGKSTIFDAIEHALFGSQKDIKPWSGGKPSLSLELNGMQIKRTNTPNTISFQNKELSVSGDEAEKNIPIALGMSYEEFMACSYIKQGMANSLLDLPPAEMMRFIQELSVKRVNPEIFKAKIQDRIKNRQENLNKSVSKLEAAQFSLSAAKSGLKEVTMPDSCKDWTALTDISDFKNLKIMQYSKLLSEIESVQKQKESVAGLELKIKENTVTLNTVNEKLNSIGSILSQEEVAEKTNLLSVLSEKSKYLKVLNEMKVLAGQVHQEFPESLSHTGKLSVFLDTKTSSVEGGIQDANAEAMQTKHSLDMIQHILECPNCQHPVKLENKTLISIPESVSKSDTGILNNKLEELSQNITGLKSDLAKLKEFSRQAAVLKALVVGGDPAPQYKSLQEVTDMHTSISSELSEQSRKQTERSSLEMQRQRLESVINSAQDTLSGIQKIADLLPESEQILKGMGAEIESLKSVESQFISYELTVRERNNKLQEIENHINNIKQLEASVSADQSLYAAAKRLKECADFAAAAAIESKIEEINASADFFIKRMFGDDGTSIRLSNFSTTQKGEERAKISIEVSHKGNNPKGTKGFSGGERSRASLCFQLGLSELYNSPILMIDEGFAGLDQELKEECLEVLKEVSQNKLVIVIEHGAPESFFDEVIAV